jgi:23S rRNA (cytosine1962-C5)-methyltransferase
LSQRIFSSDWPGYELIDAGGGEKLERWGDIITLRPEVNAYFKPELSKKEWLSKAHFQFSEAKGAFGSWKTLINKPLSWHMPYADFILQIHLKSTKHTGVFPEQAINWEKISLNSGPGVSFLNLFAYSGVSSLVALSKGAHVVHVDSSKTALTWAKENFTNNRFSGGKLVNEDAVLFMEREVKRNHKYDIIQMDPPAWGVGTQGKKWQLENQLDLLIHKAGELLTENGTLIVTTYSPKISADNLRELGAFVFPNKTVKTGVLCTKSRTQKIVEHGNLLHVY